ncbi:hypothetical protein OIU84_026953 [Salix udensis]|uniref:Tyrosine decarboxylase n=1 Tax=Salix udensis TaxID=889485 RepID=A0AAD6KFS1_9ROSI|nr:hypothetical protein OIU84_026953 [Salix udensis]
MVDFIADYYKNIETYISGSPSVRTVLEADVAAGLVPLYLCATDVANDFGLWVHVDAAYGGSSCICPEFRHHFNGIERVDSLSLSPHKWLTHMAKMCEKLLKSDPRFEIVVPRQYALVCFRVKPGNLDRWVTQSY